MAVEVAAMVVVAVAVAVAAAAAASTKVAVGLLTTTKTIKHPKIDNKMDGLDKMHNQEDLSKSTNAGKLPYLKNTSNPDELSIHQS